MYVATPKENNYSVALGAIAAGKALLVE
jgi:hypothetical protein